MLTAKSKTTADVYTAPMRRAYTANATRGPQTPALMYVLNQSQEFAEGFSFPIVLTTPRSSMADETRSELLQELAELSIDPDSMDRDSEIDMWGFDSP